MPPRYALSVRLSPTEPWNKILAMLILFVATALVVWIVFGFISRFLNRLKLQEFDRQIGALFGAAKGLLLCMIITMFAICLSGEEQRQKIVYSHSGRILLVMISRVQAVMPSEIQQSLRPYLLQVDQKIDEVV